MTLKARQQADYLVRDLYRERHGLEVPYDPHAEMKGHRFATTMQALKHLDFTPEEQDRHLKQYMTYWDDPTYGGLTRYLTTLLARRSGETGLS